MVLMRATIGVFPMAGMALKAAMHSSAAFALSGASNHADQGVLGSHVDDREPQSKEDGLIHLAWDNLNTNKIRNTCIYYTTVCSEKGLLIS
jgi:hypothetical protein